MTDDDALHRIDTHEKVCSERHGYIMENLKDLRAEDVELKAELKATKGTLRQEIENVEVGLRKEMKATDADHEKRISDIEKIYAKYAGGMAVLLFIAGLLGAVIGVNLK